DRLWQANPCSKLLPIDPAEITRAFQQIWIDAISNPGRAWANYSNFVQQYTQLMTSATLKFWSKDQDVEPVIEPGKGDKRFSAPDWQQNPVFDVLKQSYLLTATTLLKTASETEGLDEKQQRKLVFYLREFLDAISPTNFAFTNPQVLHETIQSGGQNLVEGMEHLLRDVKAGQVKMTDTDAFEPGRNLALTPGQVIHRNKLIELIQYAPTTEKVYAIPLLSMALPYLKAKGDETVNSATFFVSLQDFSEVGDTAVFIDEPQVTYIEGQMMERGYLDSRSMSTMFNMLRANDLIWSNVVNNY